MSVRLSPEIALVFLYALPLELSNQSIFSILEKARHVAVSIVGPALKELEAGEVRSASWSFRPVEDALKVCLRKAQFQYDCMRMLLPYACSKVTDS